MESHSAERAATGLSSALPDRATAGEQLFFAPPGNDECAGAEVIPGAGAFPHFTAVTDITEATETGDPPTPSCQNNVSRSVWYTFTPTSSGRYSISTCADWNTATTVTDTVVSVLTSSTSDCSGSFSPIPSGCDDNGCGFLSPQAIIDNVPLSAGTTYFIVVWKFGPGAPPPGEADVQVSVVQEFPPANDTCAGVVPITLDMPFSGTNRAARDDYRLSDDLCFSGVGQLPKLTRGRDTLYSFTAPATDDYSFRVRNTMEGGDLVVYTASDCPAAPPMQNVATCLTASNRNPLGVAYASSEEIVCQPITSGETVYVYVDEDEPISSGGPYEIEVNVCVDETESNDTPVSANATVCGIEGSISPGEDVDFFTLGTLAPEARVFALADTVSANTTEFEMRITTDTDTLEYDDNNNDAPFGELGPNCAGTPATGVETFVRMSRSTCEIAREPYRLYSVVQPPQSSATLESEPNDALVDADSSVTNYFYGDLASSGDVDLYAFNAAVGDLLFLSLDGDPLRDRTTVNGALTLLDASGSVLLAVDDDSLASSTTSGAGSLTSFTPLFPAEGLTWRVRQSGTHYARVTGAAAGDYLLSIAPNCLAGAAATDADLAVLSKIDSPDPVVAGQNLTYDIEIENNGPDAAAGAQLLDATPPGTTFVSVTEPAGWNCTTPPVGGTGAIICTNVSMAVGGPESFTIVVNVDFCVGDQTVIENTASVVSGATDPIPGNNSSSASTTASDDGTCDDGLACTENDACNLGSCEGDAKDCSAFTDDCNTGACVEPTGNCVAQPTNEGGACEVDGLACTIGGTCAAGVCSETLKDCSAFTDDCNLGVCVEPSGACQAQTANEGGPCDDSNPTTCDDICTAGTCGGTPVAEPSAIGDSIELSKVAGTTISWTDPPGDYNVYRGSIPAGGPFAAYDHVCTNPGGPLTSPTTTDSDDPADGDAFYYLVSRVDQCRESGLGDRVDDPDGVPVVTPRPNDNPCP